MLSYFMCSVAFPCPGPRTAGDDTGERRARLRHLTSWNRGVVWFWEVPGPVLGSGDSRDEWIPRLCWETGWLRRESRGIREGWEGNEEDLAIRWDSGGDRDSGGPSLALNTADFGGCQDAALYDPHHQTQPVDKNVSFRNGKQLPQVTLEGSRGASKCPFGSELLCTLGARNTGSEGPVSSSGPWAHLRRSTGELT